LKELPPKPYPDDRQLEALFREGVRVPRGRRPAPETEKLLSMIYALRSQVLSLSDEVHVLRQECQVMQRRLDISESITTSEQGNSVTENATKRSSERAESWCKEQGIVEDLKKVNGFEMILGVMEKHKHSDDDAVELLRRYREDS
jgi:hypothetical protein